MKRKNNRVKRLYLSNVDSLAIPFQAADKPFWIDIIPSGINRPAVVVGKFYSGIPENHKHKTQTINPGFIPAIVSKWDSKVFPSVNLTGQLLSRP